MPRVGDRVRWLIAGHGRWRGGARSEDDDGALRDGAWGGDDDAAALVDDVRHSCGVTRAMAAACSTTA